LNGCGENALQAGSDRMFSLVAGATLQWWGQELSIGVSMGHTGVLAGDTIESLVERAQHGLGGNQVASPLSRAAAVGEQTPSGKEKNVDEQIPPPETSGNKQLN
jgi:hypothetical protein